MSRLLAAVLLVSLALTPFGVVGVSRKATRQRKAAIKRFLIPKNSHGATCIDGSPPGYYMSRGSGSGATSWVISLMGGAWCTNMRECTYRAFTDLGSSKFWLDPKDPSFKMRRESSFFGGVLSQNATENPLFFNWNKVNIIYCDGGSFAGDRSNVRVNSTLSLNFHGKRILEAVFDDLVENRGLDQATSGLITGCSAGGHAVSLHCDRIANRFPTTAQVKCAMDGGFFLDSPDVTGKYFFRKEAKDMLGLMHMEYGYDPECAAAMPLKFLYKCFFPQYNLRYISHPVFVVNSVLDYAGIFVLNQAGGAKGASKVVDCVLSRESLDAGRPSTYGNLNTMQKYRNSYSHKEGVANANATRSGGATKRALDSRANSKVNNNISRSKDSASDVVVPSTCSTTLTRSFAGYEDTMLKSIAVLGRSNRGFGSFLFYNPRHCTLTGPDWAQATSKDQQLVTALRDWFFLRQGVV